MLTEKCYNMGMIKNNEFNIRQEEFCRLYVTKGETYGCGYMSYSIAYDKPIPRDSEGKIDYKSSEYTVCVAASSRMLTHENIQNRIRENLLKKFDDSNADARISDIIQNGKDTDAIQAVKVYNELKQRITKKVDVTTAGRPLAGLSDEELAKLAGE